METKHMPEPLQIGLANIHHIDAGRCYRVEISNAIGILIAHSYGTTKTEALDRARRLVACVNACAEITTYDLEGGIHDKRHRHEIIADLVTANKERDELAAALRDLLDVVVDSTNRGNGKAAANARAALAKLQS